MINGTVNQCILSFEVLEKDVNRLKGVLIHLFGRNPDHITKEALDGFIEMEWCWANFATLGKKVDIMLKEFSQADKKEELRFTYEITAI